MTVTESMVVRQGAAGAPMSIAASELLSDWVNDTSGSAYVIGVTTTSTPPTLLSSFAHHDGGAAAGYFDTFWDTFGWQQPLSASGGVVLSATQRVTLTLLKRLDSNYVAGRFLWFAKFAAAPPSSGDSILFLAGPYTIL